MVCSPGQCISLGPDFNDRVSSFGPDSGLTCLIFKYGVIVLGTSTDANAETIAVTSVVVAVRDAWSTQVCKRMCVMNSLLVTYKAVCRPE